MITSHTCGYKSQECGYPQENQSVSLSSLDSLVQGLCEWVQTGGHISGILPILM